MGGSIAVQARHVFAAACCHVIAEKFFSGTEDITNATGKDLSSFRRNVQFISQRPESFLDPRQTLGCSPSRSIYGF